MASKGPSLATLAARSLMVPLRSLGVTTFASHSMVSTGTNSNVTNICHLLVDELLAYMEIKPGLELFQIIFPGSGWVAQGDNLGLLGLV